MWEVDLRKSTMKFLLITSCSGLLAQTVPPAIWSISSAASMLSGPISPGQVIVVKGTGFGGAAFAGFELDSTGMVRKSIAGCRLLFDEAPSVMLSLSPGEVVAVVPSVVDGRYLSRAWMDCSGQRSNSLQLSVAKAAVGMFTLDGTGRGQALAFNTDARGSITGLNSTASPVDKGGRMLLYGTGEGLTTPVLVDGLLAVTAFPKPIQSVRVKVGSPETDAEIMYAGAAPMLVAGVFCVEVRIPANASLGSTVPLVVIVGETRSQAGVTICVK
jgi:uncharacterized protein (TIGR03437 family)